MSYGANDGTAQRFYSDWFTLPTAATSAATAEAATALMARGIAAFRAVSVALRHDPAVVEWTASAGWSDPAATREMATREPAIMERAAPWNPWEAVAGGAAHDSPAPQRRAPVRELPPNELEAGAALRDAIAAQGAHSTAAQGARRHLNLVRRFNEVYAWRIH